MCSFLAVAIGIVGYDVRSNILNLQIEKHKRLVIEMQIASWKGIVEQYKGYRDGFYQLAVLEYRIGNNQAAQEYLEETLVTDPSYKAAKQLLDRITVK
jgi:hypothetical protein